jgi:hypothetical protein
MSDLLLVKLFSTLAAFLYRDERIDIMVSGTITCAGRLFLELNIQLSLGTVAETVFTDFVCIFHSQLVSVWLPSLGECNETPYQNTITSQRHMSWQMNDFRGVSLPGGCWDST